MKKYLIGSAIVLSLVIGVGAQSAQALTQTEANTIITALGLTGAQASAIQTLVTPSAVVTAAPTFTRSLTVGSSGSDVSALQQWLVANGYLTMPAGTAYGYFGSLTKNAVAAYQAHEGISPAAGYFGPITIAHLSAMSGTPTTPVTSTVPGCVAGALFSSTTGAACNGSTMTPVPGTVVADGTDGSATASLSSYVGTGTQIKKGETKDMIAVKLQATAGTINVTRFDARFNTRPWLYFSQITLKDTSGNVIATKNLSSASDATEVIVGTDYLVRFDNVNAVVTPGSDRTFVVTGTVLASTDKLASDVSVTVSVPDGSIRTVNGKGYTDSLGDSTFTRTVTLLSTGSQGNIVIKASQSTPSVRIVTTSTSGTTNDVVLGAYDVKSENSSGTINTLKFTLNDNGSNAPFSTIFKNLRLYDGSTVYNVDSVATTSVFSNLNISIPQDSWKTLTLKADVADQDDFRNGAMASTSITATQSNIGGVDANFNTLTVTSATPATNNITFLQSGGSVSNLTSSIVNVDNGTSAAVKKTVTFGFTFNNTGSDDLYIDARPAVALASTSDFGASTTALVGSATTLAPALGQISGDTANAAGTSGVYIIPAGQSRSFTYSGSIDISNNASVKSGVWKITKIYFGNDTTNTQEFNINFGLDQLSTGYTQF